MGKRLKILSLLLCIFLFTGCSVDESLYIYCDKNERRHYGWEENRASYFGGYPLYICYSIAAIPCVEFKSCSTFYRTIKNKRLKKEDRLEMLKLEEHEGKIAIPRLSEIKELQFDGESVVNKVLWYGCSDYEVVCQAEFDGQELFFRAHHYGFLFPYFWSKTWEEDSKTDSYTEDNISYKTYQITSNDDEMIYDREYRSGVFDEGGYSYRFVDKWLYERELESDEEERTQVAHYCDIEIFDGSNYYYVYLGDANSDSPAVTREFVSSFTLKSFD